MGNNIPAFPVGTKVINGENFPDTKFPGLSIRDYFAAAALQGILAHNASLVDPMQRVVAKDAYSYADAMLAAREGK